MLCKQKFGGETLTAQAAVACPPCLLNCNPCLKRYPRKKNKGGRGGGIALDTLLLYVYASYTVYTT